VFDCLRGRLIKRLNSTRAYDDRIWAEVESVLAQTPRLGEPPRFYPIYERGPCGPLAYVIEWNGQALSFLCELDAAGRIWRATLATEDEKAQFALQELRHETGRARQLQWTTACSIRPPRLAEQAQLRARLDAIEPRIKPWQEGLDLESILKDCGWRRVMLQRQYELLSEELADNRSVDWLTMEMDSLTRRKLGLPRSPPRA